MADDPSAKKAKHEDFFAALPDDCLYPVFRLINFESADQMKFLCRRMDAIANTPAARCPKTYASLVVTLNSFSYRIKVSRDGESKIIFSFAIDARDMNSGLVFSKMPKVMSKIRERHILRDVVIQFIMLTNEFINEAIENLAGTLTTGNLHLSFRHIGHSTDFEKFEEFVLATKSSNVFINFMVLLPRKTFLFGPQFLTEFLANSPDRSHSLSLITPFELKQWTPSSEFLPTLCKFDTFKLTAIVLRPEDFIDLIIVIAREKLDTSNEYELHVESSFNSGHLARIDQSRFQWNSDAGITIIRMIGERVCCVYKEAVNYTLRGGHRFVQTKFMSGSHCPS